MSARALVLAAAAALLAAPAHAQDASRDRAELDAAAGRRVFENVLLADPTAFASRPRAARPAQAFALHARPAATGEASADRAELDAAAGRLAAAPARAQARPARPVRVILGSPYGQ